MGVIKEPKNVDLIVQSKPWTKDELAMLSAIIEKSKKKKETRIKKKHNKRAVKKQSA